MVNKSNTSKLPKTPGRPRIPEKTKQEVLSLHDRGLNMTAVFEDLKTRAEKQELPDDVRAISYNSIRDLIARERPHDPSGIWLLSVRKGSARLHAELVLAVLADVEQVTEGRVSTLTKREADWCAAIALAAPDLSGWACYALARHYVSRELQGRDTRPLDRVVAHAGRDDAATRPPAFDDPELTALFNHIANVEIGHRLGIQVVVPPQRAE